MEQVSPLQDFSEPLRGSGVPREASEGAVAKGTSETCLNTNPLLEEHGVGEGP